MADSVFKDPERVRRQMDLPGVVSYSFVGESTPEYHAKLEEIVVRVAGDDNIHHRTFRESSKGAYTAYRFEIFHTEFEEIEALYREVAALPGTRFVL